MRRLWRRYLVGGAREEHHNFYKEKKRDAPGSQEVNQKSGKGIGITLSCARHKTVISTQMIEIRGRGTWGADKNVRKNFSTTGQGDKVHCDWENREKRKMERR